MNDTQKPAATALSERIHARLTHMHLETDLESIAEALESLEPLLSKHFAEEEADGGTFEQIREVAPDAGARVEGFEDDHARILGEIRSLRAESARLQTEMDAVQERMAQLVETIRRHEVTEAQVVREIRGRRSGRDAD